MVHRSDSELPKFCPHSYEHIFETLPFPCLTYGPDGRVETTNEKARTFLGEVTGQSLSDLFVDAGEDAASLRRAANEALGGYASENLGWHRFALGKHLLCTFTPVVVHDHIKGGLLTLTDVTPIRHYESQIAEQLLVLNEYSVEIEQSRCELEQANLRLQELATTDDLTGLLNRRAFQEALHREIKRANRDGCSLSLAILDIDEFKEFNDSFGHPAGDDVLRATGAILLAQARETDTVARYGGEEFVAIMPGAPERGALVACERFRRSIERYDWPQRKITASFGVATFCAGMTWTEFLSRADAALYRSKVEGRNRVTHGNPHSGRYAA
jgi:diguanylate cyclase (GGDEF)-like protein